MIHYNKIINTNIQCNSLIKIILFMFIFKYFITTSFFTNLTIFTEYEKYPIKN